MSKPTPQQERILEVLRDGQWHCSSEWPYIKDDRARISSLNHGYMREKGYQIVGRKCDGRCGKTHSSNLFMRRAEKLPTFTPQNVARNFPPAPAPIITYKD